MQEVFNELFPIKSFDEKTILEFISYNLGVPKYTPEECIRRGITYNVTLKVKFRLTDETGIKEEEVYMGTIPVMTERVHLLSMAQNASLFLNCTALLEFVLNKKDILEEI